MNETKMSRGWSLEDSLDSIIGVFSPSAALHRKQARISKMMLDLEFRGYEAAAKGRRTNGWASTSGSANTETAAALPVLRARSRELTRNNSYAKRAIQAISTNTIGTGIRPTPKGLKKQLDKRIKGLWEDWADSTECDFDGQANMWGLQRLAMRCIAESGSVLIRRRRVDRTIPIQIQVLEPDLLDHSKNSVMRLSKLDGGYIIQGIEFDASGQRAGYWLYDAHPGEGIAMQSQFVPVEEVLHIYYKERPGQVNGVPFGSSAVVDLNDFSEYEQAQLIRQKIAACLVAFVTDASGATLPNGANKKDKEEKMQPGMIKYLPQGKTITMSSPPTVQNYQEYATAMLRKIAVGYGVSYEILSGDLSSVNFSSGRMGWLEFHRLITEWQNLMLIPMMCDPIWDWFIQACAIAGKVSSSKIKARWTPPRREMIDPAKEIKGISQALRNNLMSWSDAVRQNGGDPEAVLDEIIQERKRMQDAGIMSDGDPAWDKGRTLPGEEAAATNTQDSKTKTKTD